MQCDKTQAQPRNGQLWTMDNNIVFYWSSERIGLANENFTYTSSQIVMILQGTLLYTGDKEDTSLSKQLVP